MEKLKEKNIEVILDGIKNSSLAIVVTDECFAAAVPKCKELIELLVIRFLYYARTQLNLSENDLKECLNKSIKESLCSESSKSDMEKFINSIFGGK